MVVVSAPGKTLWIGGYSVLERPNISFVTGVDRRVYAKAYKNDGMESVISSPQYNATWRGVADDTAQVPPELKFVYLSIRTTLDYLTEKGHLVKGVNVTTLSDPAFGFGKGKSGLGSSAAVTVATVGAVLELYGLPISKNLHLVHKIAQYVHSNAQGKVGSGFDIAASCFGGSGYSRYSPSIINDLGQNPSRESLAKLFDEPWDYAVTPLDLPKGFTVAFGNFVGESASTSAMVKKVNEFKAGHPDEYKKLMHELDQENRIAVHALTRINEMSKGKPDEYKSALESNGKQVIFTEFKAAVRKGREITKRLGKLSGTDIESDECTALIQVTEETGAFSAKLPGAGGGDAIAAICLSEASKRKVQELWMNYHEKKVEPIALNASNKGVAVDTQANWVHMADGLGIDGISQA